MEIYWLKTDIDGSGKRWHLVRRIEPGTDDRFNIDEEEELGPMIEFVGEDFVDYEPNYEDCQREDLSPPGVVRALAGATADSISDTLYAIANGEQWCGMVECRSCGHTWAQISPWNKAAYLCPKCKIMSASRALVPGDEMIERIVTALVDVCGLTASSVVQWLESELNMALGSALPSGIRDDALRACRDLMPICDKCGGHGGDCDAGPDGKTVSWVCDECGGVGRKYEKLQF